MAKWISIKVMDDEDEFGERDAIICSECYTRLLDGVPYEEAPENYKDLERCPVCGAVMQISRS